MKVSSTFASVLSVAAFASAAPSTSPNAMLAFPPKSQQAHAMTIEQIAAAPARNPRPASPTPS
ncbi:hypothetical protein MN608_11921 [Microdochium nivale]|nr:hypothetical protein MN608_11921 [Microdochium nivale]